jgi:thiol:disulfide interchange protein DsbC
MRNNQATSGSGDCKTPLAEIQALGQKLGIQGTPALIFESGKLVAGAIPAEDIEKLLSQKK